MKVVDNYNLKNYNTFGINAKARSFVSVNSISELQHRLIQNRDKPIFILSGGSNMLLTKDIDALVIHIAIKGLEVVSEDETSVLLKVGAGENWHETVLFTIKSGYGGLENLSLIPGQVGTAPIQNIGAYGIELKDIFESCEAVEISSGKLRTFDLEECSFGYRESVFKNNLKNKYVIVNVTFRLSKPNHHNLKTDYGIIKQQLEIHGITNPNIKDISDAVIAIRSSKLPDPKEIGNSGSFFKNPVISSEKFQMLKAQFPDMPSYPVSDIETKIPAGWLIEKAGFKGKRFGTYGVHTKQALVLVNYGGASGYEILNLANLIESTILKIFGIKIEKEVNIF